MTILDLGRAIVISKNEWKGVADMITEPSGTARRTVMLNLILNAGGPCASVRAARGRGRSFASAIPAPDSRCTEGVELILIAKGTGPELSTAQGVIAKKRDGTLSFEIECGKGTTFLCNARSYNQRDNETSTFCR